MVLFFTGGDMLFYMKNSHENPNLLKINSVISNVDHNYPTKYVLYIFLLKKSIIKDIIRS